MIAVLGGLGSAVCWTVTGLFAQRASRRIGELSTFAWASMIGFCIVVIPELIAIHSSTSRAGTFVDLALSGVFNVVGLVAQFSALRRGRVSVVVPISSTEGAIAAMLAATTGSRLPPAGWVALAILIAGVLITVSSQWSAENSNTQLKPVGLAAIAAVCFGTGLFFQGLGGQHAPIAVAVAPPSMMGTLLVALPMVSWRRLASPRGSSGWLVGVAVAEILGFVSYILGARQSVPIAAVLSAQYATLSVLVGVTALRERMAPAQVIGLVLTIGGVTILSLLG
jgi:drug/metabolite transporter (DMT)-like permease